MEKSWEQQCCMVVEELPFVKPKERGCVLVVSMGCPHLFFSLGRATSQLPFSTVNDRSKSLKSTFLT